MAEFSDEELCKKVAQRDRNAFELLVERHQARAYRLAFSILGSESDARDVSQDAFIRLYESAGRFDGRSRFSTWFYRVLVNLCIDHKRRGRWWRRIITLSGPEEGGDQPTGGSLSIDPPSPDPGPELAAIRGQDAARLSDALGKLSDNQRIAVLLQVYEGLSSREVGQTLNCSENTARVHVHRGLAQLRKILKNE